MKINFFYDRLLLESGNYFSRVYDLTPVHNNDPNLNQILKAAEGRTRELKVMSESVITLYQWDVILI